MFANGFSAGSAFADCETWCFDRSYCITPWFFASVAFPLKSRFHSPALFAAASLTSLALFFANSFQSWVFSFALSAHSPTIRIILLRTWLTIETTVWVPTTWVTFSTCLLHVWIHSTHQPYLQQYPSFHWLCSLLTLSSHEPCPSRCLPTHLKLQSI